MCEYRCLSGAKAVGEVVLGAFLRMTAQQRFAGIVNGRFVGLAFCLTFLVGCGGIGRPPGELPQLHPARGQVTRSGQTVAGGYVQFNADKASDGGGNLIVTSVVAEDGSFELKTTHALSQAKASGAPEGVYWVTYLPPGENQDVMPVTLPDTVTIANGPNELTVELPIANGFQ
jgi:hypothetical protein